MAIKISTTRPTQLLKAIKDGIDDGTVDTWSYDAEGDLTHTPPQWKAKAWLRPSVETGELRLKLLSQKDIPMTKAVSGVYHGRFIEMILTHFDSFFSTATAQV